MIEELAKQKSNINKYSKKIDTIIKATIFWVSVALTNWVNADENFDLITNTTNQMINENIWRIINTSLSDNDSKKNLDKMNQELSKNFNFDIELSNKINTTFLDYFIKCNSVKWNINLFDFLNKIKDIWINLWLNDIQVLNLITFYWEINFLPQNISFIEYKKLLNEYWYSDLSQRIDKLNDIYKNNWIITKNDIKEIFPELWEKPDESWIGNIIFLWIIASILWSAWFLLYRFDQNISKHPKL